jgi:hypothetical protein
MGQCYATVAAFEDRQASQPAACLAAGRLWQAN